MEAYVKAEELRPLWRGCARARFKGPGLAREPLSGGTAGQYPAGVKSNWRHSESLVSRLAYPEILVEAKKFLYLSPYCFKRGVGTFKSLLKSPSVTPF